MNEYTVKCGKGDVINLDTWRVKHLNNNLRNIRRTRSASRTWIEIKISEVLQHEQNEKKL